MAVRSERGPLNCASVVWNQGSSTGSTTNKEQQEIRSNEKQACVIGTCATGTSCPCSLCCSRDRSCQHGPCPVALNLQPAKHPPTPFPQPPLHLKHHTMHPPPAPRTREGECDMYFPAISCSAPQLRTLRTQAGGELYIAIGHEVAAAFGLPFAGVALQEAAGQHPVIGGMGKTNDVMCQVGGGV